MYLPFTSFPSPHSFSRRNNWWRSPAPRDEWLPSPKMNRKMNDFTPLARASGGSVKQGVLTLWQIHWPRQPHLVQSTGKEGVACAQRTSLCQPPRPSTPRTITWASVLTAGTAVMLMACQQKSVGWAASHQTGAGEQDGCMRVCARQESGGQENRCSKERRCPTWL